jgi:hypothetical protein
MEIKLSMAIASHLSDAQQEMLTEKKDVANHRLNFVKLLVFFNKDLDAYVTSEYLDKMWESVAQK